MANVDFFYPFDSIGGDRVVTAATERRFWGELFSDGVVGDGFAVSQTSAGVFSIAPGVAIIGGIVGGITTAKSVTCKPAQGVKLYIVLRANTFADVRAVEITTTATPYSQTQEQMDAGGYRDLILYSVTGQAGGAYGLLDERTYCTSFDAQQWANATNAAIAAIKAEGKASLDAAVQQAQAAADAANAENAGLYGAAGRQGFINPCFMVNQRALASYSLTGGMTYTVDRWLSRIGGAAPANAHNIARVQDGSRMALRIGSSTFTGATAAAACVAQNIEGGVRTFCAGGRTFTVSFDAKATAAVKIAVEPVQFLAAGGTGVAIAAQTVDLTGAWQRFSLTFTGTETPTAAQMADVLKVGFFYAWRGYADRFGDDQHGAFYVYLAKMQINEGDAALPCYCKPYGDELEACRRYYVRLGFTSLPVAAQNAATMQVITAPVPLTRALRAKPTVTVYDRAGASGAASAENTAGSWRNGLVTATSDSTEQHPALIVTNTNADALTRVAFSRIDVDAELVD